MSTSTSKLSERIRASAATGAWFPMAGMKAVTCIAVPDVASSPSNEVTVQLRKATSAAGANAADLGTAKTGDYAAIVTALAEELGYQDAAQTVPYTHVQASITDEASPNAFDAVLVFEPKDVTPATDPQYVQRG